MSMVDKFLLFINYIITQNALAERITASGGGAKPLVSSDLEACL